MKCVYFEYRMFQSYFAKKKDSNTSEEIYLSVSIIKAFRNVMSGIWPIQHGINNGDVVLSLSYDSCKSLLLYL